MRPPQFTFALAFATVFAGSVGLATPSLACGGFFCQPAAPVLQAGENILFVHEDDTVTAIVHVQYTGPSELFSWVIPTPGVPEVGVSSDIVFSQLESTTDPQYQVQVTVEGDCVVDPGSDIGETADGGAPSPDGGVTVIEGGVAGPYDYEILAIDQSLPNASDIATQWLADNGYDVAGPEILGSYLEAGMNLVAFRLRNGADSNSIRPITLRYQTDSPMVPIRLTAVAAVPGMGVRVWTTGNARHVPVNYRSLVINEARINWVSPNNRDYNLAVDDAAREANGHGFVTESAGSTYNFANLVWSGRRESTWDAFKRSTTNDVNFLRGVLSFFRFDDGIEQVVREQLPAFLAAEEVSATRLVNCPNCILVNEDITGFDRSAFISAIETLVVNPLRESQELLTVKPFFTRLYTTMDPADMSVDPIFKENPLLSTTVDRRHQAQQTVRCGDGDYYRWNAPWTMTLPSGLTVDGQGSQWPLSDVEMPGASQILQDNIDGVAELIDDQTTTIATAVQAYNASFTPTPPTPLQPTLDAGPGPLPSSDAGADSGVGAQDEQDAGASVTTSPEFSRRTGLPFCFCAGAAGEDAVPLASVALLGLAALMRRRRRR